MNPLRGSLMFGQAVVVLVGIFQPLVNDPKIKGGTSAFQDNARLVGKFAVVPRSLYCTLLMVFGDTL